MTAGRLDRKHYWIYSIAIIAANIIGKPWLGSAAWGLHILWLAVLIARFHDFDRSGGVAMGAFAATLAATVAVFVSQGSTHLQGEALLLAAVPSLVLQIIAGLIPGNPQANDYGGPRQGFAGINPPKTKPTAAPSLASRRLAAVTGRN